MAFNAAFEDLGLPWRWGVEEYGGLLAVTGGRARLDAFLAGVGVPEGERAELVVRLHERKTQRFLELLSTGAVAARPGVRELVENIARAGLRLAVATTGSLAWVEPLLDRHFGPGRFEVVVGGDDVKETKPDPAAYLIALQRLDLAPPEAVAVEDSVPGLGAARRAGVACVVVPNDYTRGQDFAGAALVAGGFEELDAGALRRLAGTGTH